MRYPYPANNTEIYTYNLAAKMSLLPYFVKVCFLLSQLTCLGSTFLLSDQCMASPPCSCLGDGYIQCESKDLLVVPKFLPSSKQINYTRIDLGYNHISSIADYAFFNISSAKSIQVSLHMYHNRISHIEVNAFSGIENVTTYVDLSNNNLSSIPAALGELSALDTLDVSNNPINVLDTATMDSLGRSLHTLNITLDDFPSWPKELHLLRALQSLTVYGGQWIHLDLNAFHGFETTLTHLVILDSKLGSVSSAICHLGHLESFRMVNDVSIATETPLFEPCSNPMVSVTEMYLEANNINTFPDVFKQFPSLTNLSISTTSHTINYIDSNLIPSNSTLSSLALTSCAYSRIPFVINKCKHLTVLDMRSNYIVTVEDPDISELKALRSLYLSNNPIVYISDEAFKINQALSEVDLRNTQLVVIPRTLLLLPTLSELHISGQPIECSCTMSYLKPWNVAAISITGLCESNHETLKEYITNSLPICP